MSTLDLRPRELTDDVRYASPAGPLGGLVDRVLLERYLWRLLEGRNAFIKRVAERR